MERRKSSGGVTSRFCFESFLFFGFSSVCPPSRASSLSRTLPCLALFLYTFLMGVFPIRLLLQEISAHHIAWGDEELHSWLGSAPCQAASRLPGRKGGEGEGGCGVGPVPALQLCSFFSSSLTIASMTKPLRKRKRQNSRSEQTLFSALQCKVAFICTTALQVLRFYSVFSCVNVSEAVFFFRLLVSALFFPLPFLISHSLFCQISSSLCEAFLFTLLYPIMQPLSFLFCRFFFPFHSKNSAVVEQWLNRNNICCTLPPSWSYSPLTTSLIFSCVQGLVISCGWCRVTFAVWDLK